MSIWPSTGLSLQCVPDVAEHISRPWDAADDYLIDTVSTTLKKNILIVNDRHGALTCHFQEAWSLSSQACAREALRLNANNNHLPDCTDRMITEDSALSANINNVIIKVPKSLDLLQHWLEWCRQQLPSTTRYWLAGMSKHIPISWLTWLEQNSSEYQQYPIVRKARLIQLTLKDAVLYNKQWIGYRSTDDLVFEALPGVFARKQIDIGSAFLLQHLPSLHGTVIDLGCGNGLLALTSKKRHPQCKVIATDDAWQATKSCRHNAHLNKLDIVALQGNGLSHIEGSADWILCNPPFHDGHKQLTDIAIMMFQQAAQTLNQDGQLLVIANRHLPYFGVLKGLFHTVDTVASNSKFNLYRAQTPRPKTAVQR